MRPCLLAILVACARPQPSRPEGAPGLVFPRIASYVIDTQVTPEQASQMSPSAVQDLANHAEKHDASIFDKLGSFYAQHPQLVKTLGSAALTIALAKMADRMRS